MKSIIDLYKDLLERLKVEDREGFVVGWDSGLCVKFLDETTVNIVAVTEATVFTNSDVGFAEITNAHGDKAALLKKADVIDKSIANIEISLNLINGV
jgi:hypothetical protein